MINRVTITGADDSVDPMELAKLWDEFPFVEWGILISKNNYGNHRFPSLSWILKLRGIKHDIKSLPLSMHLCGTYVRELVKGNEDTSLGSLWNYFERAQLNFHAIPHSTKASMIEIFQKHNDTEFIFQHDGVNDGHVKAAYDAGCKVSALFDKSGGAGILPNVWPEPLKDIPCGYAGGLSPDNLEEQIKIIESIVGEKEIWIDMETHVRSNMDAQFDLVKVRRCLEISSKYIL